MKCLVRMFGANAKGGGLMPVPEIAVASLGQAGAAAVAKPQATIYYHLEPIVRQDFPETFIWTDKTTT